MGEAKKRETEGAYELESADDHVSEARHQLWGVDRERLAAEQLAALDAVLAALDGAAAVLGWLTRSTGGEE